MDLELRDVRPETAELALLQQVLEDAPGYTERVTGLPVGPADAQSLYAGAPEGFDRDRKHVWFVQRGDRAIGCVDVLDGYPEPGLAWIGLLLVREDAQGRGLGTRAWERTEDVLRGWGHVRQVRLAVVRTNDRVLPFWRARGFAETGEVHPYRYAHLESESLVLAKDLV